MLVPKMTGHKPVKSTKPPMKVDPRNPTLVRHPGPISIEELEAMNNGAANHFSALTPASRVPEHSALSTEAPLDTQERAHS